MPRALLLVLTIFLWFGQSMFGQFSGLAVTDDGTQVYFSSTLQLIGTKNENPYSKIFRFDGSGRPDVRDPFHRPELGGDFHLVAQVDKVANGATTGVLTNFYNLSQAYVSGDGKITGYVGTADCVGAAGQCVGVNVSRTTLPSAVSATLPYACQVNRNAQFALCHISGDGVFVSVRVVSLVTGAQSAPLGTHCFNQPHTITSDGRAVLVSNSFGQVDLVTVSSFQMLNLLVGGCASINDDGSRIVAPSVDGSSLIAYDVATGVQSTFFTTTVDFFVGSISNDGNVILLLLYTGLIGQAAVVRADGTGFLQLTNEPNGVSTAVISGDGSTVFVVTNDGKLLKIDPTSGASSVLARAAEVQQVQGGAAAGSLNSIQGAGLADATIAQSTFPLTTSLGGAQVTINGRPAPLLAVSPSSISFQIPWETALGSAAVAVVRPSSQFVQAIPPLQIQGSQPVAAFDFAISLDFSQVNSPSYPANPGDIVNFYLTGLGAVTAPVADGALSPSNPLPRLANPVTVSSGSTPLTLFYAGLAPGQIGIYQLSVQTPLKVSRNPLLPNGGPVNIGMTINSYALPGVWMIPNQ